MGVDLVVHNRMIGNINNANRGSEMKQNFKDYTITMQDDSGRTCVVSINGDCIAEQISNGETESNARLNVEDNAVSNAIYRKEISAGAWLIATA